MKSRATGTTFQPRPKKNKPPYHPNFNYNPNPVYEKLLTDLDKYTKTSFAETLTNRRTLSAAGIIGTIFSCGCYWGGSGCLCLIPAAGMVKLIAEAAQAASGSSLNQQKRLKQFFSEAFEYLMPTVGIGGAILIAAAITQCLLTIIVLAAIYRHLQQRNNSAKENRMEEVDRLRGAARLEPIYKVMDEETELLERGNMKTEQLDWKDQVLVLILQHSTSIMKTKSELQQLFISLLPRKTLVKILNEIFDKSRQIKHNVLYTPLVFTSLLSATIISEKTDQFEKLPVRAQKTIIKQLFSSELTFCNTMGLKLCSHLKNTRLSAISILLASDNSLGDIKSKLIDAYSSDLRLPLMQLIRAAAAAENTRVNALENLPLELLVSLKPIDPKATPEQSFRLNIEFAMYQANLPQECRDYINNAVTKDEEETEGEQEEEEIAILDDIFPSGNNSFLSQITPGIDEKRDTYLIRLEQRLTTLTANYEQYATIIHEIIMGALIKALPLIINTNSTEQWQQEILASTSYQDSLRTHTDTTFSLLTSLEDAKVLKKAPNINKALTAIHNQIKTTLLAPDSEEEEDTEQSSRENESTDPEDTVISIGGF